MIKNSVDKDDSESYAHREHFVASLILDSDESTDSNSAHTHPDSVRQLQHNPQSLNRSDDSDALQKDPETGQSAPSLTDQGEAICPDTIFVGGLSFRISEDELRYFFEGMGEVLHVYIKPNMDPATGRMRGYGFVTFRDAGIAERLRTIGEVRYESKRLVIGPVRRSSQLHSVRKASPFSSQPHTHHFAFPPVPVFTGSMPPSIAFPSDPQADPAAPRAPGSQHNLATYGVPSSTSSATNSPTSNYPVSYAQNFHNYQNFAAGYTHQPAFGSPDVMMAQSHQQGGHGGLQRAQSHANGHRNAVGPPNFHGASRGSRRGSSQAYYFHQNAHPHQHAAMFPGTAMYYMPPAYYYSYPSHYAQPPAPVPPPTNP